jgi:hypothetical protein
MKFLPGYFNVVIVEMEVFKVLDTFSFSNMLNNFLFSGRDVDEPKVVVFGPQEASFSWKVVESGGVSKVPIQELFLGCLSDFVKGGILEVFEVPLVSYFTKGKEVPKFVEDVRWISPTVNQLTLTGVE